VGVHELSRAEARDRKCARDGKCKGRKGHAEMDPELLGKKVGLNSLLIQIKAD
jgi:hypothetical protein